MNPDRLLRHFERISEAPVAVPRLRRFILDLAVRGKFVEQDLEDEPATELLKRIGTEKARLIKVGEMRQQKPLPPVEEDNCPFDLPPRWKWVPIREITTDRGQKVPEREFSYIDVSSIDKERGRIGELQILTPDVAPSRARKLVNKGDVIYSCVRPYLLNIAVIEDDFKPEPIASTAFAVLNGFGMVSPRYLWIVLRSPFFVSCVEEKMRGQAYPAINDRDFAPMPFPLPPLAEQHRIVAKVDAVMALCDQLEAAQANREKRRDRLVAATLHGLNNGDACPAPGTSPTFEESARFYLNHLPRLTARPEHIRQLRQTILNLAVRGKLVPQNPNDEPAGRLLAELRKAKDRLQEVECIRAREFVERTMRSDLTYPIPASWERTSFDEVFVIVSGVTKGRNLAGRKTLEVPYLRVANVQRGYLDLRVVKSIRIPEDELSRYLLRLHDILMTEGGDWDKLGRAAIWMDDLPRCIHQNHVFRVRPALPGQLLSRWVITYTNSTLGRGYFEFASKQTTNLASINMTQLRGCPLPLPPLAEQHRIVAKVDELMALCDELETRLTATADARRQILEATLHESLSGKRELRRERKHGS